jgi:trimethylamine:corrinoid methyltransferase-like protein
MAERPRRRKGGGRSAKRAARQHAPLVSAPYIEREIPYFEMLGEEALELTEKNADTVLEEIGIEFKDFQNFVKLAYMSPGLHHSGGTVCEPVNIPVNKRHFNMTYSHLKCSDKAFMGSVTAPGVRRIRSIWPRLFSAMISSNKTLS